MNLVLQSLDAFRRSVREACNPVDIIRDGARDGERIVASYLGDARGEKGFDLLPGMVRQLVIGHRAHRFLLKSQIYYSGPRAEPGCVASTAALRAMERDNIWIMDGALESRRYAREILKSNVILIPYARHNYASRSSGIFSEALAAGIPTVVPAGTWMSAEIDRLTQMYHAHVLADAKIVTLGYADLFDMVGSDIRYIMQFSAGDTLPIRRGPVRFFHVKLPENASYVRLSYQSERSRPGIHVMFHFSFHKEASSGGEIRNVDRVVGGRSGEMYSILEPVPPQARSIWLGMYPAFSTAQFNLEDFRVGFICEPALKLPRTAGGIVYRARETADGTEGALTAAMHEMLADYNLYAESSRFVQDGWLARHSAETFVKTISDSALTASPLDRNRFTGTEW